MYQHTIFRSLALLLLLAVSRSQTYPYCNICGNGMMITEPKNEVFIPTYGIFTCELLEERSHEGFVPPENCFALQTYSKRKCGCEPAPSPTSAPIVLSESPSLIPTFSAYPTSEPSTSHPTFWPTLLAQPSNKPSIEPTTAQTATRETLIPSDQPTMKPSRMPSHQPSFLPSSIPSLEPSSGPTLSAFPTLTPSLEPSSEPTMSPSTKPSAEPSLSTVHPSAKPSITPSHLDSNVPSSVPSLSTEPSHSFSPSEVINQNLQLPNLSLRTDTLEGLTMGLVGIPQLHDVEEWKSLTAAYILNYVSTADARFFGTTITVTDVVEVPAERRSLRQMQGSISAVTITYSQEIVYKTIDAEKVNAEYIVTHPFAEANDRETYKNLLRRSGVEGLAGITSVTRVQVEGVPSPKRYDDITGEISSTWWQDAPAWLKALVIIGAILVVIMAYCLCCMLFSPAQKGIRDELDVTRYATDYDADEYTSGSEGQSRVDIQHGGEDGTPTDLDVCFDADHVAQIDMTSDVQGQWKRRKSRAAKIDMTDNDQPQRQTDSQYKQMHQVSHDMADNDQPQRQTSWQDQSKCRVSSHTAQVDMTGNVRMPKSSPPCTQDDIYDPARLSSDSEEDEDAVRLSEGSLATTKAPNLPVHTSSRQRMTDVEL